MVWFSLILKNFKAWGTDFFFVVWAAALSCSKMCSFIYNWTGCQKLGHKCVTYLGVAKRKMGPINPATLTENHAPGLMSNNGTGQINLLTLILWTIWRFPTNASKWQMGFNSAFKGLKPTGHAMHLQWTFNNCTLCPHCIYMFCIYLRTHSDLCHLRHKLIGFYNRDEKCLLRGTNWVFN